MGKDTPDVPDYKGAAEAQGASSTTNNTNQTWANRPNVTTPWGSFTWESKAATDPSTGQPVTQWNQNVSLSPDQQNSLDAQQRITSGKSNLAESLVGRAQDEYSKPFDWGSLPDYGKPPENERLDSGSKYYDKAGDAVYNSFSRRMDPQFEQQRAALDTRLQNQGLKMGDEAYDSEMKRLQQEQGDQRLNAMDRATTMSGEEASRMYGMDQTSNAQNFSHGMQSASYATALRQQVLSEQLQKRGFSLNEINAILNGQQIGMPSQPSFMGANKADTIDYMGAAKNQYQGNLDTFNAKQAQTQMLLDGVSSFNPFKF